MQLIKTIVATALGTAAGFSIHVFYGRGWADNYTQVATQAGRLSHVLSEPYPRWVIVIAAMTALVPTFGKVAVYALIQDRLPGRTPWQKGLAFGGLLLLMSAATLRQPFMNILIGIPGDVAVVEAIEPWTIDLLTGLIIALVLTSRRPERAEVAA